MELLNREAPGSVSEESGQEGGERKVQTVFEEVIAEDFPQMKRGHSPQTSVLDCEFQVG